MSSTKKSKREKFDDGYNPSDRHKKDSRRDKRKNRRNEKRSFYEREVY